MNDVVSAPLEFQDHPLLHRRRNSISTPLAVVPTKLTFLPNQSSSSSTTSTITASSSPSSSFPSDDLEMLSIKPPSLSYTSLRDLLPSAAVNSPYPNSGHPTQPGSDICIKNRLVKQAAWAYLQPMSTSPGSAGGNILNRLWPPVAAFFDFLRRGVIRVLNWTLRVIQIRR